MTIIEAFEDATLAGGINQDAAAIISAAGADKVSLATLFIAFLSICVHTGLDAGTEFETALAYFEARNAATHRMSMAVN